MTGKKISPKNFADDTFSVLSDPLMQKVYTAYDNVSASMREYLNGDGFLEYKSILMGPVTDPGIRGSKQVTVDYYGYEYKMMSSAILYKQLLTAARKKAGGEGKIYFFADNIRLEPTETANTDRHLAEFIQVDIELADTDHYGAMSVAEGLLTHVCRSMKRHEKELSEIWDAFSEESGARGLEKRTEIRVPKTPFKRYTHKEAVDELLSYIDSNPETLKEMEQRFGFKPKELNHKTEIHWEYEWLLSRINKDPFFVYDYPKGSRGFYDREYDDKKGVLMDFDMLFPGGYGEAASGAAREYEHSRIIARMKETGEKLDKYRWYLEFLKSHGIKTAGFGIGLERTVRYICGLPSIYMALPCPRIPGLLSP